MALCTRMNQEPVRIVFVHDAGEDVEIERESDGSRIRCRMSDLRADAGRAEIEAAIVAAGYPVETPEATDARLAAQGWEKDRKN